MSGVYRTVIRTTDPGASSTGFIDLYNKNGDWYTIDESGTVAPFSAGFTQEEIEDFVGAMVVGGTGIDATYDDGTGTITLDLDAAAQASLLLADSAAQTANNVGAGNGIFRDKTGTTLNLKTIVPGTAMSMSSAADTVTVNFNGDKTSVGLGNVDNTSDANKPVSTLQQAEIDTKQDILTAAFNQHYYNGPSGGIIPDPNMFKEPTFGGLQQTLNPEPNNNGGANLNQFGVNIEPLQASPNENYSLHFNSIDFDNNNSGFDLGTNGKSGSIFNNQINHNGTGDIGSFDFISNNFDIGNGTDAIDVGGFSYNFGFGNINANVTVSGAMQGYGYQPAINASATIDQTNGYTQAFYDAANISTEASFYTSFNASPTIAEIGNNKNYNAFSAAANITTFNGNAGFTGLAMFPTITDIDTGYFNGVQIGPTVTYTGAGSFTGIIVNPTVTNAPDNSTGLNINMNNVSGTFTPGQTPSAIDSTGRTNMQATHTPFDGGGNPFQLHGHLATVDPTVSTTNSDTVCNGNIMFINPAASVALTSGPFGVGQSCGYSVLIPDLGAGASVDYVTGHMGVLNLQSGAGTIEEFRAFRSTALKIGGSTTVTRARGYYHHAPFGPVASTAWGCYIEDDQNYFEAGVKIGGTSGTDDTPDSGFLLHVEGDSKLEGDLAHLTGDVGFYGTTPITQPTSSGAATAGAVYTATEQTMLQEVYDAVRSLGLMS